MEKRISGRVVSYMDIPQEYVPDWLSKHYPGAFVECHLDDTEEYNELDEWLANNYPGIEEETFYIEMDY